MAMKIAARYANGVFTPETDSPLSEGAHVWLAYEDRFAPTLPDGSPLWVAARRFERAFDNGVWSDEDVREGCRLAWETMREAIARAADERGWAHDTLDDLRGVLDGLDGEESSKEMGYSARFYAALAFYHCADSVPGDYAAMPYKDVRDFQNGLETSQRLLDELGNGVGSRG